MCERRCTRATRFFPAMRPDRCIREQEDGNEDPSDRRGGGSRPDTGAPFARPRRYAGRSGYSCSVGSASGKFIHGSVLDRSNLQELFRGCDCIVHIAAWHGIHEDRGEKNAYDFFDLNVRGTFEVFEAAASLGIDKMIYISTTSVRRPDTLYGRSKILAERIAEDYAKYSNMNVITLRPRGFIPYLEP